MENNEPIVTFLGENHVNGKPLTAKFESAIEDSNDQPCSHCQNIIEKGSKKYLLILDYYGVNVCGKCVDDRLCVIS